MVHVPRGDSVSTRVIRDEAEWEAIRLDWEALYASSPYASAPLDFTWLWCWWRVYGAIYGSGGLRVVTVWRGSQLVGAIPLYMSRGIGGLLGIRTLRFIATGEAEYEEICPDYLNLLCLPGEESACVNALWGEVAGMEWDHLECPDLPAESPLLRWKEFSSPNAPMNVVKRGSCPIANLDQGFEAYLKRLSAKTRQHARQYLRAADRSGAVFELATAQDSDRFFDDLIRLHQLRWTAAGKPGCFSAPRFTEFHRQLARDWLPSGRAVLGRLSHGEQVYVVLYGFVTGPKFDFYQSGVRVSDTGPFDSPGTTANLLLMSRLADRGITHYDFLRGSSSFKEKLATHHRELVSLHCRRSTVRANVFRASQHLGRGVRKVARLFGRK